MKPIYSLVEYMCIVLCSGEGPGATGYPTSLPWHGLAGARSATIRRLFYGFPVTTLMTSVLTRTHTMLHCAALDCTAC